MEYGFVALVVVGKEAELLRNLILEIPFWSKSIAVIFILCNSVVTLAKAYSQMYNGKSRHLSVKHSMICFLFTNRVISIELGPSSHFFFLIAIVTSSSASLQKISEPRLFPWLLNPVTLKGISNLCLDPPILWSSLKVSGSIVAGGGVHWWCLMTLSEMKEAKSFGEYGGSGTRVMEMVADLRYFNSLESEVDSLTSQLETQKTQFVNEIDCLSREYYYADHMNTILGVYTELDEVTNM
nr:zinc finger, CCHC-type [Tanacetum cinerariifolium]